MRTRTILLAVLILAVIVGLIIYRSVEAPPSSAAGRSADVSLPATTLFAEFQQDEVKAGKRYNDKLVEVTGTVRAINLGADGTEVLLETGDPMGAVVCDFKTRDKIDMVKGSPVRIQGYCAGYNMDVLLQRCSVAQ